MSVLSRVLARTAAAVAVAAASAALLAAPASAAAPTPEIGIQSQSKCAAPLDGTTLCLYLASGSGSYTQYYASVFTEEGRTLAGALLALVGCDYEGKCVSLETRTGANVRGLGTPVIKSDWEKFDYYQANASWVDDRGNVHTGVLSPR